MNAAEHTNSATVSDQMLFIEKQRAALQCALKISRSIEQLYNGLRAAHAMGGPSSKISPQVLATFEQLSVKTQRLSTPKLKSLVETLDFAVAQRMAMILRVAKSAPFSQINGASLDISQFAEIEVGINQSLSDFRRQAQTAVALRVLLDDRGIQTAPLSSSIAESELINEIQALDKKQEKCRDIVKKDIVNLQNDVEFLLTSEGIPDEVREAAMHMRMELQGDLDHILAGKEIETMPSFVEVIELKDNSEIEAAMVAQLENAQAEQHDFGKASCFQQSVIHIQNKNASVGFFAHFWAQTKKILFGAG